MRNRVLLALAPVLSLLAPSTLDAKGSGGTVHVKGYTKKDGTHVNGYDRKAPKSKPEKAATPKRTPAVSTASTTTEGDSHGKIKRSESAKHAFEVQSGYLP